MVSTSTRTSNDLAVAAPLERPPQEVPAVRPMPHPGPQRLHLMRWLQESLSTDLVCVLHGRGAVPNEQESVARDGVDLATGRATASTHRNGGLGIAPFMAQPNGLVAVGPPPDELAALKARLRETLVAERVAVETYRQVIGLIRDREDSTRQMVEALLADELEHVAQLEAWLAAN